MFVNKRENFQPHFISLVRIEMNIKKLYKLLFIPLVCNTLSKSYKLNIIKYNVLLILVDDLRYLDNDTVSLPNIQAMAKNGVNFKYAYAQQALCYPSRISIFTGRRPDTLHFYDSYGYSPKSKTSFKIMPQVFLEFGYKTYAVGKVIHTSRTNYNDNNDEYFHSWSQPPYVAPSNKFKDKAVCEVPKSKKLKKNLICPIVVAKQPNQTLPDLEILNEGIRILKQSQEDKKPFFLAIGFYKPNIPLKFPRKYLDNIPISKIRPPLLPHQPTKMPLVAWHPWMDIRKRDDIEKLHIVFPMGTLPMKWILKIRQSYYAATLYIDDLIGELITHVNRTNTIIVLTSDHGWSLGENGLWSKHSNFDVALRVPLIFEIPRMKPKAVETPVELLDVFPTLVELVGLKKNITKCKHRDKSKLCFEGKSLVPLMKKQYHKKTFSGQPFAFSQYPRPSVKPWGNTCKPLLKDIKIMGYSVRTNRYRYTEWVSFNNTTFKRNWSMVYGKELYDHTNDSSETNNVYLDKNYRRLAKNLSKLLRSHVERGIYNFSDL